MSVRSVRRSFAMLVCVAVTLLPRPASSVGADAPSLGERGSGPEGWIGPAARATGDVRWDDVNRRHWARSAIDFVAASNDWMRDFPEISDGIYEFRPDAFERRALFARSLVRAFPPEAAADPSVTFADLPESDRFHRWASVAVANDWMRAEGGAFRPDEAVTTSEVHRALVLALDLGELADGADGLHLRDGTRLQTPPGFGTLLLGMRLGLRYNHADEALDVGPDDALTRAEVAWSLYRAVTAPPSVRDALEPYASLRLPNLSDRMVRVVEFGIRYVGHPYVWGGEWNGASPSGYCCGWQPRGGFDCSGLTWWLMKRQASGWDNTPPREYQGWDLPQRSSAQMATVGNLAWEEIRPGDLLFYDGNDDGTVDHVDTYIGAGWALDSGSSNGGVTITRIAGTWYEDHFVHARRIVG